MRKYVLLITILAGCFMFASCSKKDPAPEKPVFVFKDISGDILQYTNPEQVLAITLNYTMDASSFAKGPANSKILIKDSRDSFQAVQTQPFPVEIGEYDVPDNLAGKAISGQITVFLRSDPNIPVRPTHVTGDTLQLKLQLIDPAGAMSLETITPNIYLVP